MSNDGVPYRIRMALIRGREFGEDLVPGAMYASLQGAPKIPRAVRVVSHSGLPLSGVYVQLTRRNNAWQADYQRDKAHG